MPLNLQPGARCFVDANILTYFLIEMPPFTAPVDAFMRRAAAGEIIACSSSVIISEALHRVMLSEVGQLFPQAGKALSYIQRHPKAIGQLIVYNAAARRISQIGIQLLVVDMRTWDDAAGIAASHALLTNDASIVATMRQHGVEHLVTNDDDFDNVPGITVWKPR